MHHQFQIFTREKLKKVKILIISGIEIANKLRLFCDNQAKKDFC
jgi:hypothetical protein